MHWLDIIILIVLLFFFLVGVSRGLISQIFSLAAIAGGFVAGLIFYDVAGRMLIEHDLVETTSTSILLGFILVVIITFIIIQILGWLAAKMIGKLKLGWLNRLAGGVVGIVIGIIATFFLLSWMNLYIFHDSTAKEDSILAPYVYEGYGLIVASIPEDLSQGYENTKKRIIEESEKAMTQIKESDKPKGAAPAQKDEQNVPPK